MQAGYTIPIEKNRRGIVGGFIVISKYEGRFWNCKCTTCSKIKKIRSDNIRNGKARCYCHRIIDCFKIDAKKRKIRFDISDKKLWELLAEQNFRCALTGQEIYFNTNQDRTISLDRIDSSLGYIDGNVQWVHTKINQMKYNYSVKEFIYFCKLVAEHNKDKNENT